MHGVQVRKQRKMSCLSCSDTFLARNRSSWWPECYLSKTLVDMRYKLRFASQKQHTQHRKRRRKKQQ